MCKQQPSMSPPSTSLPSLPSLPSLSSLPSLPSLNASSASSASSAPSSAASSKRSSFSLPSISTSSSPSHLTATRPFGSFSERATSSLSSLSIPPPSSFNTTAAAFAIAAQKNRELPLPSFQNIAVEKKGHMKEHMLRRSSCSFPSRSPPLLCCPSNGSSSSASCACSNLPNHSTPNSCSASTSASPSSINGFSPSMKDVLHHTCFYARPLRSASLINLNSMPRELSSSSVGVSSSASASSTSSLSGLDNLAQIALQEQESIRDQPIRKDFYPLGSSHTQMPTGNFTEKLSDSRWSRAEQTISPKQYEPSAMLTSLPLVKERLQKQSSSSSISSISSRSSSFSSASSCAYTNQEREPLEEAEPLQSTDDRLSSSMSSKMEIMSKSDTLRCLLNGMNKPNVSRKCKVVDCIKSVASKGRCATHGGGKRCCCADCDRIAVSRGLCRRHGGGKRCDVPMCLKGTQSNSNYCWAHGGGKRCEVSCCMSSTKTYGLCAAHLRLLYVKHQPELVEIMNRNMTKQRVRGGRTK